MKGPKLIILISSILLLTISSGLLFYKNLFSFDSKAPYGRVDFEELRYNDLQINATAAILRKNMEDDQSALMAQKTRIKELLDIVTDVNKSTEELSSSIKKIEFYFNKKLNDIDHFQKSLKELKTAIDSLTPTYNELNKNNIKFIVEKKDFYKESIIDSLFYTTSSNRDNELRLLEDKKILSQVLNFANTPNPIILKFNNHIDTILKKTKEIDLILDSFNKENTINNELAIVGKYYKETQNSKAQDGEIFLTMVFGAIVLYLICIVVILRKLT